jgi:hypothetical protein
MIIKRVLQWQAEKPPGMDVAWILEKNLWQRTDSRANETTKAFSASPKQAEPRWKI